MKKKKFYFGRIPKNKFGMFTDKFGKLHWAVPHMLVKHYKGRRKACLLETSVKITNNAVCGAYLKAGLPNAYAEGATTTRRVLKHASVYGTPQQRPIGLNTAVEIAEAKRLIERHDAESQYTFQERLEKAVEMGLYMFINVDRGNPGDVADMICTLDNLAIPRKLPEAI